MDTAPHARLMLPVWASTSRKRRWVGGRPAVGWRGGGVTFVEHKVNIDDLRGLGKGEIVSIRWNLLEGNHDVRYHDQNKVLNVRASRDNISISYPTPLY